MNIIETHDLTKIYETRLQKGNVVALSSVALSVRPGEVFGLLGPNGAGKTTLVKVLLGITRITSGDALINGLLPSDPASRERVGYLPENPRFPDHVTGLGLIEFAGRLSGLPDKEIDERAERLLELVGMTRWANTKVRKYSKGMNERIGLAQALIADPDILFLDEPTDGIDPVGKMEIRRALKQLRDQGKTIFLNSHLLAEVEAVADRVAILRQGKIIKIGTVDELTVRESQYEIEADIGNERIDIPEAMGKRLTITSKGMTVVLNNPEDINRIIDEMRLKRISIRSIKPVRQTLEQSFMDVVGQDPSAPPETGVTS